MMLNFLLSLLGLELLLRHALSLDEGATNSLLLSFSLLLALRLMLWVESMIPWLLFIRRHGRSGVRVIALGTWIGLGQWIRSQRSMLRRRRRH
jgi:hypothetical protein